MVDKMGILIQAHMKSTRLPGKILKEIHGKSVLGHIIERLKKVNTVNEIVVATSNSIYDDVVVSECKKYDVPSYRGSDENVLSRFYGAAKQYDFTDVVRICSDNTLLDWTIISNEITHYKAGMYDIVTSGTTIPLGLGGEIFSFEKLEEAFFKAREYYQKEHVTPYIYENYQNIYKYNIENDYSKYRFTLDTVEDWILINKLYDSLYDGTHDFLLPDIIKIMESNVEWYDINKNVIQKKDKE